MILIKNMKSDCVQCSKCLKNVFFKKQKHIKTLKIIHNNFNIIGKN